MRISVVVRSRDEAPRLRLTLAALSRQTMPAEVVVVDDGSSDETADVLREARGLELRCLRHAEARGRAAASNAGVRLAGGDVLLFLDGDTLPAPDLVARHAARHAEAPGLVVRGDNYHLRCTRFFRDPETGTPQPGAEEQVARMGADWARSLVTRAQVLDHFEEIDRRASPSIYPGVGPRRLYDLEMDALLHHPGLRVLWMAASGHNFSVPRDDFLAVGGFEDALEHLDHREIALRLCRRGLRMTAIPGARSYHLTHRTGWRDPLLDWEWRRLFQAKHPGPAVELMTRFWRSLAGDPSLAAGERLTSLPEVDQACTSLGYEPLAGSDAGGYSDAENATPRRKDPT